MMPIRLYHPDLTPPDNGCEVITEAQAAVMAESGWLPAPEPEPTSSAHVPEPVMYAPVEPAKAKSTRKTASPAEDKE